MSQNIPCDSSPAGAPGTAPFDYSNVFRPLLGLLTELALIALGWGVGDLGAYLSHPLRVLLIGVLGLQTAFNIFRRFRLPRYNHYRIEHIGVYRVQLMALESVMVIGAFCDARSVAVMPESVRWWGLALFLLGSLAMAWTIVCTPSLFDVAILAQDSHGIALEQNATVAPGAEPVRPRRQVRGEEFRQGPYRWLRYPTTLAQLGLLIGLTLTFRAWPGVAFCAMYVFATLFRTQEMDAAYQRFYGRAWTEYAAVTRRFIPLLY